MAYSLDFRRQVFKVKQKEKLTFQEVIPFVKPFNGFITLSKAVQKELQQFTQKPIAYHPHPIDEKLGEKIPKKEALEYLQLDVNKKYLLFFGLVRKYKGVDLTLEALNLIKDKNIHLLIVGEFYEPKAKYTQLI